MTAAAMVRLCFGVRVLKPPKARKPRSAKMRRARSAIAHPASASSRMLASCFESGHGHIADVRACMAQYILHRQIASLNNVAVGSLLHRVINLAMDETEMQIFADKQQLIKSVCMLHARVRHRFANGECQQQELALPPAVLEDTTSQSLLGAIESRASFCFTNLGAIPTVICFNSDKAKALLKLGRHLAAAANSSRTRLFMAMNCMMHMMWAALSSALAALDLCSALYCASILLHRGNNMALLRTAVRAHIDKNLVVVFEAPAEDHSATNEAILRMLDAADHEFFEGVDDREDQVGAAIQKRRDCRRSLSRACPGNWLVPAAFVHYCSWSTGCNCRSRDEAVEYVFQLVLGAALQVLPVIPALNRWNKLYGPIAWWLFACCFHGVIAAAVIEVKKKTADLESAGRILNIMDLVAGGDDRTYQAVKCIRWGKTAKWIQKRTSAQRLLQAAHLMQPVLQYMGKSFYDARFDSDSNIVPFLWKDTSPAERAIVFLCDKLEASDDDFWSALVGGTGWTESLMHSVGTLATAFMAGLALRCVFNFDEFPAPLGLLPLPHVPIDVKRLITARLFGMSECCTTSLDGISLAFRARCGIETDALTEENLQFLKDIFNEVQNSNIRIEDRFARCRKHQASCSGHAVTAKTMSTNHFVSEFSSMHSLAVDAHDATRIPRQPTLVDREAQLSDWQRWVAVHRKGRRGVSLRELSNQWQRLCKAEKETFWHQKKHGACGLNPGDARQPQFRFLLQQPRWVLEIIVVRFG